MKNFLHNTKRAVLVTVVLMIICGLIYPLVLTGISKVIFPRQAEGSLIRVDGKVVGAETIGQEFTEDYYMWGRPSAYHYNTYTEDENGNLVYSDGTEFAGVSSGSNNYAPTNEALTERVENDMEKFLERNQEVKAEDIPTDLLTASGSGLSEEKVEEIVSEHTEGKLLGVFGEETVNVLMVNLDIAKEMGVIPAE